MDILYSGLISISSMNIPKGVAESICKRSKHFLNGGFISLVNVFVIDDVINNFLLYFKVSLNNIFFY